LRVASARIAVANDAARAPGWDRRMDTARSTAAEAGADAPAKGEVEVAKEASVVGGNARTARGDDSEAGEEGAGLAPVDAGEDAVADE
jgi:hypothetical protein